MNNNLIPYNNSRAIDRPGAFTSSRGMTIEAIIGAWLNSKDSRSHSAKTAAAYSETIKQFRAALQSSGHDLIWNGDDFVPTIADYAQIWAGLRSPRTRRTGNVSRATYNQRLAILSSFYAYAIKRRHIETANPIDLVDRPHVEAYGKVQAIEEGIEEKLKGIDPATLQGSRDLALLAVLLSTGRRVSEVANLCRSDIMSSGKQLLITFSHTKGDKVMTDLLSMPVSRILQTWLETFYGVPLASIAPEAPVWVNVHHASRRGQPLGYHGVSGICKHYLGTSKVHTTRHTFAVLMEQAGAKLTDIQRRLGHKNAATTGIYLERLSQDKNPFAERIAASLGLTEE